MKTIISLLVLSALFFSPSSAEACMDSTLVRIGKANTSFRFNNRKRTIKVCFRVKISRGAKAPRFIGYRFPAKFVSKSSMSSKEIMLKSRWEKTLTVGKLRAFRYRRNRRYCLTLKITKGTWEATYNNKTQKLGRKWKSAYSLYKEYKQNLIRESAMRNAHRNLVQKRGKKGATVGSEYITGSSGAKGGCGTNAAKWPKIARRAKPRPRPLKVNPNDFQ